MLARAIAHELRFGKAARRERPIAHHVPYTRHVDDATLGTKDGRLLSTIKLDGFCFQTADQSEVNLRHGVRNTIFRALGSSRFQVYAHIVRREVRPDLAGEFESPFARELDRRYMAALGRRRMFTNDLYVTVVRRRLQGSVGAAESLLSLVGSASGVRSRAETEAEARRDLRDLLQNMVEELQPYGARLLALTRRDGDGVYSEPAEFLVQLLNGGVPQAMRLPRMGLDGYLGTKRLFFGRKAIEIQGATVDATRFASVIGIKEYPPLTGPGLLDGLLQSRQEFILSQSFSLVDKPVALERMDRLQRQIGVSDEGGTALQSDLDVARDQLVKAEAVFGQHHLSLLCLSRSLDDLDRVVSDLGSSMTEMNINWVREDLNQEAAFWAQLPGNESYIARSSLISSRNFAGFVSLHNFAAGQRDGTHWGSPVALLETVSQTPYLFNFHQRDLGNFTVVGPSGSGKTVGLSFLMAQAMRIRPTPRAVFVDKDRGAEIFIRALGGSYEILQPGRPTGFNPLQLASTPANREFLFQLFTHMLRPRRSGDAGGLGAAEERIVRDAIEEVGRVDPKHRRLDVFVELLRGRTRAGSEDLAARLVPWINLEQRGWLFNNADDTLHLGAGVLGFDMTKILDEPETRTAALLYLFHRIDELLDGTPILVFLDEGWKLLDDELFVAFLTDKMKTIRKLNGVIGFGTQSAADIARSRAAHTLIEQSATNIFFPNTKADEHSYREAFRLSERELAWVRETGPESRTFLIKHGRDSVIARLNLSGMPDLIKVLSGRAETVAELDRLRSGLGDDPASWLPAFCGWNAGAVS